MLNKTTAKLRLGKEILKRLASADLRQVAGGAATGTCLTCDPTDTCTQAYSCDCEPTLGTVRRCAATGRVC